jgi:iron complex outermembrane receptor protein
LFGLVSPALWAQEQRAASNDGAAAAAVPPVVAAADGGVVLADTAALAAGDGALVGITVTARKREELLEDVPVPETVVSGKALERNEASTISDFAQFAPNVGVNVTNSRQSSISIRGIGKNSANEAMQPSVGIIVDGVVLSQVGMSYGSFVDLDQLEVLRGPQGTLQGKNTTLGAINITSKLPEFTPESSFEAGYGQRKTFETKGYATGPVIDDALAYRASFYAEEGDGPLVNQYAPLGGTWGGPNRFGGRLQLLAKPGSDLTARLILNYDSSDEYTNVSPYVLDPTTFANGTSRIGSATATSQNAATYSSRLARPYFDGYVPLIGPVTQSQIDLNSAQALPVHQRGASLQLDKGLGEFTLTSITAYRENDFNFRNDFDYTHFDIETLSGTIGTNEQYSQELRLASPVGPAIDYQAGLYALHADSYTLSRTLYGSDGGAFFASNHDYHILQNDPGLLRKSLNGVYATTEIDPYTQSFAAFGQLNWHWSQNGVLTLGLRDTDETVGNFYNKTTPDTGAAFVASDGTSAEIAAARDIRTTTALTGVFGARAGTPVKDNSVAWLVNPSYKLTPDVLLYASAGHGTKSGAVQFDAKGNPANVAPETSLDYEIGFKSVLLEHSVLLNVNLYQTQVNQFQANASVPDPNHAGQFVSLLTNVGGVRLRGVELDGAWSPAHWFSVNLGAAYNDAVYSSYADATCPVELNTTKPCNFTGEQVSGAPRYTADLGVNLQAPISPKIDAHVFLNDAVRSRANLTTQLSEYGWQAGYAVLDGGVGIRAANGKYEFDVVGKNLLGRSYAVNITQYSNTSGVSYFWGDPRFVGAVFRVHV